jgi:hypothetical protein
MRQRTEGTGDSEYKRGITLNRRERERADTKVADAELVVADLECPREQLLRLSIIGLHDLHECGYRQRGRCRHSLLESSLAAKNIGIIQLKLTSGPYTRRLIAYILFASLSASSDRWFAINDHSIKYREGISPG